MGQFSKSKFQLEIWSVAVAISVRSSDLSAGGVAATTCCKHTARKATITRECQALSLNSPGAMSKWPVVMIGMDSLGPQVKTINTLSRFLLTKKYRSIWVKLWIPKWLLHKYGWIWLNSSASFWPICHTSTNHPPGFEIECNLTQLRNLRVKICKWSASFSVARPAEEDGC